MGKSVSVVRTARKYVLLGQISQHETDTIAKKVLANDCIEEVVIGNETEPPSPHLKPYQLNIVHWPVRDLDDDALLALSKEKDLFLNLQEMQTIQKYYQQLNREPTDVELEA
ncbi:MAG: phosphoribosylformylglycinamidine synthase subunit PurL, partial [Planctomycetota bacterium]